MLSYLTGHVSFFYRCLAGVSELLDMIEANPDINIGENIVEESENVTVSSSQRLISSNTLMYMYMYVRTIYKKNNMWFCRLHPTESGDAF